MVWVKALHVIFMVAWFAGLFYLPRIYVNLAMNDEEAVRARLLVMAHKLYRFITPWMLLTIVFGLWMLFDYAWAAWSGMGWLHVKLLLVLLLIVYHVYCGRLLRVFEAGENRRSHVWYRWFNEAPVLILFSVVILTIVKPF